MTSIDYVAHLSEDGGRFAAAVEAGPLDASVVACDWDLRQLAHHLGHIHRWARLAVIDGTRPDPSAIAAPPPDDELGPWLREGLAALVDALASIDPEAPTWHPFPVARRAGVWPRRQSQETLVHRWDAEDAIGTASPMDPALASDGVDEYFEMMLPRLVSRESLALPESNLHVHCTDIEGEWLVRADGDGVAMTREHAKGDAALRGRAEDLLLALWGRAVPEGSVDVIGDSDAAASWLALGGA